MEMYRKMIQFLPALGKTHSRHIIDISMSTSRKVRLTSPVITRQIYIGDIQGIGSGGTYLQVFSIEIQIQGIFTRKIQMPV